MEDLEQIMRRIHVLFAKCEPYGDESDGRIIVPKKEVFRLLEKLNYAVIHMMDAYEGTAESRERGLNAYQRESEKIRENAQAGADDVYAASLIYTDNMLEELGDVLADAKEELWEQYARMAGRLDEQARMLVENQEEIKQQLSAMAQGEKYLRLIERENIRLKRIEAARVFGKEAEPEEYEELDEEEEDEELYETDGDGAEDAGGEDSGKMSGGMQTDSEGAVSDESEEASGSAGAQKETKPEKTEKKRKQQGRASGGRRKSSAGKHARMSPDLEAEWAAQEAERPVRKIGTAFYEDVGQAYDAPVKKVTYEVKVNQAYFDQLGEGSVDLDAEYYQWKEEQEQAAASVEGSVGEESAKEEGGTKDEAALETDKGTGRGKKGKKEHRLKFGKHK